MGKRDETQARKPADREAKLAQALRANLRRRKSGVEAKPAAAAMKTD